jgi:hypothetical protein
MRDFRGFFLINPKTLEWCSGRIPNFIEFFLDYDGFNYITKTSNDIDWRKFYDKIF